MGNGNDRTDSQQRLVINFIDPLFSVVLSSSFAQIYTESWFRNFWYVWKEPHLFEVSTLLGIGYLTVILSWVGYHQSIKSHPIDPTKPGGRWRFGTDVLLLIVYFVLLVSYENFRRELWIVVAIYTMFVVWDHMKIYEVGSDSDPLRLRRGVTVFWFLGYLLLALFYQLLPPKERYACQDWLVLIAAVAGTFLYRRHKATLWFKGFLRVLGYSLAQT